MSRPAHRGGDPLAPARGCLIGLIVSLPFWIVVIWAVFFR